MKIRKAKEEEIKDIYQLINESNRDAYTEIIPPDELKDPILELDEVRELFEELNFYVYTENGKILGVAGLKIDEEKTGKIRWVHVHPNHRRKKIGTKLMKKIEKTAKKENLERLHVMYVHKKANWARDFYSDLGYKKIGKTSHPHGTCFTYRKEI